MSQPSSQPEMPDAGLPSGELLMFVGLIVKAAEEQDQRLLDLYLRMAEESGLSRSEVLAYALRRRPGNPLLASLS